MMITEFDRGAPSMASVILVKNWWLSAVKDFGFLFHNSFVLIIFPFVKGPFSLVIFSGSTALAWTCLWHV